MSNETIAAPSSADTTPTPATVPTSTSPAPAFDHAAAEAFLAAVREAAAVTPAPSSTPPAVDTTPAPAPSSTTPAGRPPVGALVEFDTVDVITNERVHGIGIVRGHVADVDDAGNTTGPVLTKVTPLPNDYVLVGDDELVADS